jgi:hypothetical protein
MPVGNIGKNTDRFDVSAATAESPEPAERRLNAARNRIAGLVLRES